MINDYTEIALQKVELVALNTPLTDDEIDAVGVWHVGHYCVLRQFARAIEREKEEKAQRALRDYKDSFC